MDVPISRPNLQMI